jgi:hypothetical protein
MATATRDHHLDPRAALAALEHIDSGRPAPPRRSREYLAIAAACLVVGGTAVGVYTVRGSGPRSSHQPGARSACAGAVVTSALPPWARAGFSPNAYVNPHVTGASGAIIGVLFTDPLRSPPAPGTSNKILWIAKDPGSRQLLIRARLEGSDQVVTRTVPGGPGPSIIDMPAPGCWQLTLTWSTHTDTTALPYEP